MLLHCHLQSPELIAVAVFKAAANPHSFAHSRSLLLFGDYGTATTHQSKSQSFLVSRPDQQLVFWDVWREYGKGVGNNSTPELRMDSNLLVSILALAPGWSSRVQAKGKFKLYMFKAQIRSNTRYLFTTG